jgi:hypothetical protein
MICAKSIIYSKPNSCKIYRRISVLKTLVFALETFVRAFQTLVSKLRPSVRRFRTSEWKVRTHVRILETHERDVKPCELRLRSFKKSIQ